MPWVAKVSKPNINVLTGADKDLIFTSDRNCLKAFMEATVDTDSGGNLTINHNLGYIPSFAAFTAASSDLNSWFSYDSFADIYATTTTLVISGANGGVQSKVYYAIFIDQL